MARLALVPSAIPRAGLPLTGNRGGAPGGHGACVAADAALVVLARGCAPIMHKGRLEAFSRTENRCSIFLSTPSQPCLWTSVNLTLRSKLKDYMCNVLPRLQPD